MAVARKPIEEREYLAYPKRFIESDQLQREGIPGEVAARMLKSGEVEAIWITYRLFLRRKGVNEWLAKNAPRMPRLDPLGRRFPRPRRLGKTWKTPDSAMAAHYAADRKVRPLFPYSSVPPQEQAEMPEREPRPLALQPSPGHLEGPQTTLFPVEDEGVVSSHEEATSKKSCPFSVAELRALRRRIVNAESKAERSCIYEEIGVHPQTVGIWLRKARLPRLTPTLQPKAKKPDTLMQRLEQFARSKRFRTEKCKPQPTRGPVRIRPAAASPRAKAMRTDHAAKKGNSGSLSAETRELVLRALLRLIGE